MAEELQSLLERIQTEAVDTATKKADEIVAKAREKAAAVVKEAEDKARQQLAQADQDAKAFAERSRKTLEQAARDLLITIGQGVNQIFARLVAESVDHGLTPDAMKTMLVKVVEAMGGDKEGAQVVVSVSPKEQQAVAQFFLNKFKHAAQKGLEVQADNEIFKGFRVTVKGENAFVDYTSEAIAESLMNFLRPQLAEIVRGVAVEKK